MNELVVRKPAMRDIPPLLRLINGYAGQGIMLARTEFEIAENLRDFHIITCGNSVAGCAALHLYTPTTGEVRSLAVDPQWKQHGVGRRLMEAVEREAAAYELADLFAFTYIPEFFRKLGFAEIERGALPLKAWKDCLRCPKFQCCDEIAVIKTLQNPSMRGVDTLTRGVLPSTIELGEPDKKVRI